MTDDVRLVSPYRPFAPVRTSQVGFDWVRALGMLRDTARRVMGLEVFALTDEATDLPDPVLRFPTDESKLMLWMLAVSLAYLESEHFDRDTIFVCPDTLIVGDLRPYFSGADLTILARVKFPKRPILNSVQWWPVAAKGKLQALFRQALALAPGLPHEIVRWGADSESLRQILAPVTIGRKTRGGLDVDVQFANNVLGSLTARAIEQLHQTGTIPRPTTPIIDFKHERKACMPQYYAALCRMQGWS